MNDRFLENSKNKMLDTALGPEIVELLNRPDITELYVNNDGRIWYQSYKEPKKHSDIFVSPERVKAIIETAAGQAHKLVNEDIPSISTEIIGYGYRFQGELPPVVLIPSFNIRKKATKIFTLDEYVENGTLQKHHKEYIEAAIRQRKNILVSGGTGTGKTTMLNAILNSIAKISPEHRIISLEDLPELQCSAEDYSPMFTKQETTDQKIVYDMTKLLADCMRRSPDRIIVGEVRDGAAYTMLKAWNTGHPGGACTVHANDALSSLDRIDELCNEAIPNRNFNRLIGSAIDVCISIVHVVLPDGRRTRKVEEIIEVEKFDSVSNQYVYKTIQ